jgi:hypothetical protein
VFAIWVAVVGLTCGLLLPSIQTIRDGEGWSMSAYNLKQIGWAVKNYHEGYGRLPPAALKRKDGQPLLSWRVLILPYLEQDALFREFRLDEPWDGPHNRPLLAKIPKVYARWFSDPAVPPHATHYQAFVGPGTAFEREGLTWDDFLDGRANTLLVVEAAEPVPWTKPDDLRYDPAGPLPGLGMGLTKPVKFLGYEVRRRNGFNAAFADGTVRFLDAGMDEATLRAVITRNGGEPMSVSKLE